jgi:hypothetical protein
MTQGFFTIAFGKYYRKLARNLLVSYKINGGSSLPFYVITDKKDQFVSAFDHVIVMEPSYKGRMNKLNMNEYLLFDENIFFDADCLIYGDLKEYFPYFGSSEYHVTSFERNDISWCKGQFTKETAQESGLDIPMFDTGIIYFRKDEITKQIMDDAKAFSCDGNDYNVLYFGEGPFFALALTLHKQKCLAETEKVNLVLFQKAKIKEIDITKKRLVYISSEETYSSPVVHFSAINTRDSVYLLESLRASAQYKHSVFSFIVNMKITFWHLSMITAVERQGKKLLKFFNTVIQYYRKGILLKTIKKRIFR